MRPRIRTVKPEALKDEELWDLEASSGLPLYRAFQGLWMFADREGRFEWRPRALKSDILPYWDGDFERCLQALERGGFIQRYEVNGRLYGVVPNLGKHQRFDHREPQSVLPPPPGHARAEENDAVTVVAACPGGREGKGREQEGNGNGKAVVLPPPDDPPRLKQSSRELGTFGAPALKFDWDPDWLPSREHQARGFELGLTDDDIGRRLFDCQHKTYPHGFKSEDHQFFRELGWEANDKKVRLAKEARSGTNWEKPGAHRQRGGA